MASLLEDLSIGKVILGDLASFAAGTPVAAPEPVTIAGKSLNLSVVHLGTTQPTSGYTVFEGGFLPMLETGITIGAEFAAGEPIAIAEKIGTNWYGETFTPVSIPVPASAVAPAA